MGYMAKKVLVFAGQYARQAETFFVFSPAHSSRSLSDLPFRILYHDCLVGLLSSIRQYARAADAQASILPRELLAIQRSKGHRQLPDVASNVGHRSNEKPWPEFLAAAKAAPGLHIIETHHPPQDDEPAIYVVRDGRAPDVPPRRRQDLGQPRI